MQDQSYDDYDAQGDQPSRFGKVRSVVSTAIGAVVAMSLLMALGIWFYRLGVRDAQNVPIIRAALEPAKTRPDDPGGAVTPHQDVESYEVAEQQPAQVSAAVIAPPAPEPRPEDVPMADLEPVQPEPEPEPDPAPVEDVAEAPTQPAAPQQEAEPVVEPDNEQLALNETPEAPAEEPAPVSAGTALAPKASPIARRRPSNLQARMEAAVERDRQSVTDLAARAASSRVQIQLAANPDQGVIRAQWNEILKANGDILRDRTLAIQSTVSGGVTFYRLRVGPFRDAAEARAICQALKARNQDCILARNS